ncbi:MAG TPA: hypothetical protein VG053_01505 [Solirubrobacteraceae bacterium]|jgi:hypothetical protein|nr:hypothetical protein [Solirubrobacteraceae bacterium]
MALTLKQVKDAVSEVEVCRPIGDPVDLRSVYERSRTPPERPGSAATDREGA